MSRAIARPWCPKRAAVSRMRPTIFGSSGGHPNLFLRRRATSKPAWVLSFNRVTAQNRNAESVRRPRRFWGRWWQPQVYLAMHPFHFENHRTLPETIA